MPSKAVSSNKTAKTKKPVAVVAKKTKPAPKKKISAAKKPVSKKAAPKKLKAIREKMTKPKIIAHMSEKVGIEKKTVNLFFDELNDLIQSSIMPRSFGEITLPIGIKIRRHDKPATKARMGRNPFSGEEVKIAAKPKSKVVKVKAMKALKELLEDK